MPRAARIEPEAPLPVTYCVPGSPQGATSPQPHRPAVGRHRVHDAPGGQASPKAATPQARPGGTSRAGRIGCVFTPPDLRDPKASAAEGRVEYTGTGTRTPPELPAVPIARGCKPSRAPGLLGSRCATQAPHSRARHVHLQLSECVPWAGRGRTRTVTTRTGSCVPSSVFASELGEARALPHLLSLRVAAQR